MLFPAQIIFPDLDPVALQLGPLSIKWYGLAYLVGLLLGWLYIRRLLNTPSIWANAKPPLSAEVLDDLLIFVTAGVILGGRLGFVLLYEPGYYLANPLDIIKVWKGGMSFHGALIGTGLAILLFARLRNIAPWRATDVVAAAVPLGLFFGRLANFINAELYGRTTDVSWSFVFCNETIQRYAHGVCPAGVTPRHPSQLYEAILEGLLLFLLLRFLTHHRDALKKPGIVTGAFLIGYGLARSFAEFFREPHAGHALNIGWLTAGMAYSIPMILLGIWLWHKGQTPCQAQA